MLHTCKVPQLLLLQKSWEKKTAEIHNAIRGHSVLVAKGNFKGNAQGL